MLVSAAVVSATEVNLQMKTYFQYIVCRHGQSNPTFYLRKGSQEFVLRKKPPGKLLRHAHQVMPNMTILFHGWMSDIIFTKLVIV